MTYLAREQFKNNTTADGKHVGRIGRAPNSSPKGIRLHVSTFRSYAGVDPETGKSLWYTYKTDDAGNKEPHQDLRLLGGLAGGPRTARQTPCRTFTAVSARRLRLLRRRFLDRASPTSSAAQVLRPGLCHVLHERRPAGTVDRNTTTTTTCSIRGLPKTPVRTFRVLLYNDSNQAAVSDRFLTSASYLNIQNITLGYTLPKRITRKFLVENLRIYLACDNVWYWSKRQGLDPRQSIQRNHEPVLLRPDSHLLGRCNRNVLIC